MLIDAVRKGDLKEVEKLLNSEDLNVRDKNGYTPLHYASRFGYYEIVNLLLEHGANPNVQEKHGSTPLHIAVYDGRIEIVNTLLYHGADPNIKNRDGWTPLHIASSKGYSEIVKILLEHGADPNIQEKHGSTPLHVAVYDRKAEIVKILLDHGADPNIRNNKGETAVQLANWRSPEIAEIITRKTQTNHSFDNLKLKSENIKNESLGKYFLVEKIGEGGFATVYKGKDKNGKEVAVKLYKSTSKDFVKEVAVWLNLNHPNIVKLLDYDITPTPYVVMELMKGGTLEGKKFDKITATRIILDTLQGLKYAHSKGIVHRDVKPSNILLDENGRAKISDWGIAKLTERTTSTELSMTLQYASPEELSGLQVDEKSDIYQVCEVFYEILTGKPAFSGDLITITSKKTSENFVLPSVFDSSLAEFDPLFKKCFSPRKEDRYSDDELIKILSNNLINTANVTVSKTNSSYAYVELAYAYARLGDYERALFWLKELNKRVDCKDVIQVLELKVKSNYGTQEEGLKSIELLRSRIGLHN